MQQRISKRYLTLFIMLITGIGMQSCNKVDYTKTQSTVATLFETNTRNNTELTNNNLANSMKEKQFEATLYKVIELYNKKNSAEFKTLIHPDYGLYIYAAPGAMAWVQHLANLCFTANCKTENSIRTVPWQEYITTQIVHPKNTAIYFNNLPNWDELMSLECAERKNILKSAISYSIPKQGLLSNTLNFFLDIEDFKDSKELLVKFKRELKEAKILEKDHRVVIIKYWDDKYSEYGYFVFYLSYIENNWYLYMLDFDNPGWAFACLV